MKEWQDPEIRTGRDNVIVLRDMDEPTIEEELAAAKFFNKVAVVIIIFLMILAAGMLNSLEKATTDFEILEQKYEQLYEDLKGGN